MSVAAYVTSRVSSCTSMSTSRSLTLCSSRTSSSTTRRKSASSASSSSSADIRCLSSSPNQQNHFHYGQDSAASSPTYTKSILVGLSAAGAATIGASALDSDTDANKSLSLCEPDATQQSFYQNIGENLKTLFWLDQDDQDANKENLKIPIGHNRELSFEPSSASSSSIPIPGRVIDAVKASVDTASEWEKKAKETVRFMTGQYPKVYDVSVRALKGDRLAMEDRYSIHDNGRFTAVFDGHGGGCVSTYLSKTLFNKITNNLKKNDSSETKDPNSLENLTKAIKSSFKEVDEEILMNNDYSYQGSTAVAIWVHEDGEKGRTIVSANVGDSRAVLSHKGNAINLTKDHKPEDSEEKKRILNMGEKIEWDPYCNVYRVCNLSLSRAIGDKFAKPAVSSDVDIKLHALNESDNDDFVVLASDGLWDVMSSQDCVDFVNKRLNPSKEQIKSMSSVEAQRLKFSKRKNMSRFVANEALRRGSSDNVCVIIVWLNKPQ